MGKKGHFPLWAHLGTIGHEKAQKGTIGHNWERLGTISPCFIFLYYVSRCYRIPPSGLFHTFLHLPGGLAAPTIAPGLE